MFERRETDRRDLAEWQMDRNQNVRLGCLGLGVKILEIDLVEIFIWPMSVKPVGVAPDRFAFIAARPGQGGAERQPGIFPPAFSFGNPAEDILVDQVAVGIDEMRLRGNVGRYRDPEAVGLGDFIHRLGGRPNFGRIGDGNAVYILPESLPTDLGNLGNKILGHSAPLLTTLLFLLLAVVCRVVWFCSQPNIPIDSDR